MHHRSHRLAVGHHLYKFLDRSLEPVVHQEGHHGRPEHHQGIAYQVLQGSEFPFNVFHLEEFGDEKEETNRNRYDDVHGM